MIKVEIPNRILLQWDGETFKCAGPLELLDKVASFRQHFGSDPKNWPSSEIQSESHVSDILLSKFIQKVKRSWSLPYKHDELCHCRLVLTEKVTNAIEQGAQTVAEISRVTLAGTGCGTCRTDCEQLIAFYFQNSKAV